MSVVIKVKDKEFFSFEEFGKNIYLYPEESYKLINSKKFLTLLKKENLDMYNNILSLRKNECSEESFLFKAQYVFNKLMDLRFYRCNYSSLKILGKKILNGSPKQDVYIKDLLKYKLISYYMVNIGIDKTEPNFYQNVLAVEDSFSYNESRAYFKLGFILSESKRIVYKKKEYDDVNSFFSVILSKETISDFASDFEKTQYIFAWLEVMGYEKEIIKFESIIASVEDWEE